MGKLAERLADAERSGAYRVETTEAVEEAASLNRQTLVRIALTSARGASESFRSALAVPAHGEAGRIVLASGFEPFLSAPEFATLLAEIGAVARAWREQGKCLFVAFVDPSQVLNALSPLYHWRKSTRG